MSDNPQGSSCQSTGPISQSLERLRREFDRWIETALQQGGRALDAVGLRANDRQWSPTVEVVETPMDVLVEVDLPGVEQAAIDVSIAGNMLTVQGPKSPVTTPAEGVVHFSERMHGPFHRSVPMPAPVVADGAVAELKHGVLRLRIPKSEKARPMRIAVRGESATPRPAP